MQIKELSSKVELQKTFEVINQIYKNLEEKQYIKDVLDIMQRGYKIAGVFEKDNGECIGITGIRILQTLQYGKTLQIEDFMICRKKRGVGVGKMLIRWVEWQAMNFNCNKIITSIDSARIESHKILSREGFILEGFKFLK